MRLLITLFIVLFAIIFPLINGPAVWSPIGTGLSFFFLACIVVGTIDHFKKG